MEIKIECKSCGGTGLYVGMAEREGAAVICHDCHGQGWTIFKFKEFTGRKIKEGVKRVYQKSYGFVIGTKDTKNEDGELIRFSQFGCTYEEWINGKTPSHIEDLACPYMAENKGIGNEPCNRCKEGSSRSMYIPSCKYYSDKASCWEEFKKK